MNNESGRPRVNGQPLRTMAEVERQYILRVLAATEGNRTEAARILGLDRKTLYRKLLEYSKNAKSPICWRDD